MNRLDIIKERKKELEEKTNERLNKIQLFYKTADLIKLNEDTKHFFQLAYDIYGKEIIERIRNSTNSTQSEKDALLGKFDLLYHLVIKFINNIN